MAEEKTRIGHGSLLRCFLAGAVAALGPSCAFHVFQAGFGRGGETRWDLWVRAKPFQRPIQLQEKETEVML
ncbi:hypothetical protein C8Q79DRAFT_128653 [Trametes meyenii]|nr:hypothetical protein C8Q79DRAFT_128653 [Trametes meyenii]